MGQPLPHERGRGRARGGNREVPPATLEGGTWGKRSFPPRERAAGERRSWPAAFPPDELQRLLARGDRSRGPLLLDQVEQPTDLRPRRQAELVTAQQRLSGLLGPRLLDRARELVVTAQERNR